MNIPSNGIKEDPWSEALNSFSVFIYRSINFIGADYLPICPNAFGFCVTEMVSRMLNWH